MTPLAYIKIAILAVVFGLGGTAGYWLGNHSADGARKALAEDMATTKIQGVTHDQLVAALKAQNIQLQADADAKVSELTAIKKAADVRWQAAVAQQSLALDLATKNSTQAQLQVTTLKAALFLAMTPDEKELLQKQLDGATKQLVELQTRTDGLKCLTVPIPQDYLDAINATAVPPGASK